MRAVSIYKEMTQDFLVVQWLGVSAFIAGGPGLIPGQGTKIPHVQTESRNDSLAVVHRLPAVVASLAVEHRI